MITNRDFFGVIVHEKQAHPKQKIRGLSCDHHQRTEKCTGERTRLTGGANKPAPARVRRLKNQMMITSPWLRKHWEGRRGQASEKANPGHHRRFGIQLTWGC